MSGEHHHQQYEASHAGSAHQIRTDPPRGHEAHSAQGERGGHDKHAGHSVEMFRKKFWISLALTIPTLLWGHMLARLTGRHAPLLPGGQGIAPLFGTAVFVYGGWVFCGNPQVGRCWTLGSATLANRDQPSLSMLRTLLAGVATKAANYGDPFTLRLRGARYRQTHSVMVSRADRVNNAAWQAELSARFGWSSWEPTSRWHLEAP